MVFKRLLFSIFISVLVHGYSLQAQDCSESKAYKKCPAPKDARYKLKFNWSRAFKRGQTKQFVLTFNKGLSYYLSACTKEVDLKIHIKLLEDNKDQTVLYDNAINELSGVLDINSQETKKMIVEISVPPKKIYELINSSVCVGIRLFYLKQK
jgi:hypothetical protein